MKLLASSSYDYMKLMVMELQEKLQEIEEAEKRAAARTCADGGDASAAKSSLVDTEPKAPPRQRPNPFNNNQKTPKVPAKVWAVLHSEFGTKISMDRQRWCQGRGQQQQMSG